MSNVEKTAMSGIGEQRTIPSVMQ